MNGNILAARTFIIHFVSLALSSQPTLRSPIQSDPISIPGSSDEITFTTNQALNFLQLAVRTCQRAHGAANKKCQEAWVRLSGTYLSKGGVLAQPEVRMVSSDFSLAWHANFFSYILTAAFE